MSEIASSSFASDVKVKIEDEEPPMKKCKAMAKGKGNKLEDRLEDILCCVVCLDLPICSVYQCSNGHLMCAGCFTHLLADARLRDEEAKCPTCRVEFSKQSASRNLAVEKALSELPSDCRFCSKHFPRNLIAAHEEAECDERLTGCKFMKIGCLWRGPYYEKTSHEKDCLHPRRTGAEVMETLQVAHDKNDEDRKLMDTLFDLMSYEKIIFNDLKGKSFADGRCPSNIQQDLQMRPYRTDEYLHKLFYETSRFSAFFNQWVVKARIHNKNNSKADPSESSERSMMYQLCLKSNSKPTYPITVHFLVVRGPFGDMKVKPKIYKFEFTENDNDSPYMELPLHDTLECNRLLAAKVINFRLIMFIVSR